MNDKQRMRWVAQTLVTQSSTQSVSVAQCGGSGWLISCQEPGPDLSYALDRLTVTELLNLALVSDRGNLYFLLT